MNGTSEWKFRDLSQKYLLGKIKKKGTFQELCSNSQVKRAVLDEMEVVAREANVILF